MDTSSQTKWYDNKILVIILLIVFFPAGLYGLWKGNKFSSKSKVIISGVVVLALIIGAMDDNEKNAPYTLAKEVISFQYLPVSRGEILSIYTPQPDKIGSENTSRGTSIDSYSCKFHTLELESHNGKLTRVSLKYSILNMKANTNAGMSFVLFARAISQKIAGIVLGNDSNELDKLGLNDIYSPGPDELIHNGVKLRRYTKGGVLIFEAIMI